MNQTGVGVEFQEEVEFLEEMANSNDKKGPAVIGATETENVYDDDLEMWVSNLETSVVEEGLELFPQLGQCKDTEASESLLDEFVDINSFANDDAHKKCMDKIDFSLTLDGGSVEDAAAIASKLLSEEENDITDQLLSYVESNVSSPEMDHQSVDNLLNEFLQSTAGSNMQVYDDTHLNSSSYNNIDLVSEILLENDANIDKSVGPCSTISTISTADDNDNFTVDEKVVAEFAELLNSFDEWHSGQSHYTNIASVDTSSSINVVCDTVEEVEIIQQTDNSVYIINEDVNKLKRKADRRIKNNEASKVTRAKRKCKHKELFEQERTLTESNAELRMKVEVMQKEADILKQLLIVALTNGNKQE
jgi:hypothetical protein